MKKLYAVIGAGYGDEGKGLFTDYLSSLGQSSVVIRYNGGAQAGHTVVSPEGKRHVFGHFGANSFLKNSKTVLSRFFVVNPLLFKKEFFTLNDLGLNPTVFCHEDAYVTTPFDMIINQLIEKKRGASKHGSCGLGFGQTIERQEKKGLSFVFKDLLLSKSELMYKLSTIRQYFIEELNCLELGGLLNQEELKSILSHNFLEKFYQDCVDVSVMMKLCREELSEVDLKDDSKQIVFEGAQGLMLDQFYGSFPHVTRSNTGLKNIMELIKSTEVSIELNVFYATRCYVTRHGAGPLYGELVEKPYPSIIDETNVDNLYQGSLRFAHLNMDILKEAIQHDLKYWVQSNNQLNVGLAVSCLDQTDVVKFFNFDNLQEIQSKELKKFLFNKFDFVKKIMESYSPTREMVHIKNR